MGHEIHYADLPNPEEQSIRDFKEYVGDEVFQKILDCFEDPTLTYGQFCFICSMAGVQGFPVRSLWTRMGRELPDHTPLSRIERA